MRLHCVPAGMLSAPRDCPSGVVTTYGALRHEGEMCFVMKLYTGGSLLGEHVSFTKTSGGGGAE